MARCTGQPSSLDSQKHDFRNAEDLKCNCICHICGSTFRIEANESWAVYTDGLQAQNENTIWIREESANEVGGTQPFGTKTRSLGKQCKNFLNKPQIPSYMTSHPKRLCPERGLYSLPCCEYEYRRKGKQHYVIEGTGMKMKM
jgi:hypothetical protein